MSERITFRYSEFRHSYVFSPSTVYIGYTADYEVDHLQRHDAFFFSFITKGAGALHIDGREYSLQAPCAFIQYPGVLMRHRSIGPWNEMFIGFAPEQVPLLRKMGLFVRSQPTWRIGRVAEFMESFERVLDSMRSMTVNGVPDLLERQVQELILLSRLPGITERTQSRAEDIQSIADFMKRNQIKDVNLAEIVAMYGMSYSTFIRSWDRMFSVSPQRYLMTLRMDNAVKLLVGSSLRINEIAEQTGFHHPFYFSKLFRDFYGVSPSEFRAKNKK